MAPRPWHHAMAPARGSLFLAVASVRHMSRRLLLTRFSLAWLLLPCQRIYMSMKQLL